MEKIGFQSGIDASINALVALDPSHKAAYEKLRRTLKILASAHDAAVATPPPPPPPDEPPPPPKLAPMTHYTTPRADARYCVRAEGVVDIGGGKFRDEGGFTYTENGLCDGGRSGKFVSVLKPADSLDGLEPCDGYEKDGRVFPPWPQESYEV